MKKILLFVSLFASFSLPIYSLAGESCAKICASGACGESCNGGTNTHCHCQSGGKETCGCADHEHEHAE